MENINLTTEPWEDYELLDSGDNRKLERYGSAILIRPETQAIWRRKQPDLWSKAVAEFIWSDGKGAWHKKDRIAEKWALKWRDVSFSVRLTSFKHTGLFPEQAPNWEWIDKSIRTKDKPNVLNLFGYTGLASIVAAKAGATVTHLDASRQSNSWAKENAIASDVTKGIRYILDDAMKFVKREGRRGVSYDGVILDPPAFGRGPKGEVWRIEEDLPKLMDDLKVIFSHKPGSFLLLNGYAAGYTPLSFEQLIDSCFGSSTGEFGELRLKETDSSRSISEGIYVRLVRN
ncbi:MAG: class I SAM-dependent methyltransferase [Patescibacteria group bacterium]|nr:class I SAM-dependent methyltransferase [Patescibacteria group bacterium]MCL5224151.1 class I SAM-dependent methyltransferase [Patescibacteria group bacterium]